MALVDFTGFENWNTTAGYAPPNWTQGTFVQYATDPKSGSYCGRTTAWGTGGLHGFSRTLVGAEQHATLYVGFWLWIGNNTTMGTLARFSGDAGATHHVTFTKETAHTVTARLGNYDGTSLASASIPGFALSTWRHFELKVVLGDGTSGAVACRVDGSDIFNVTGIDTKNGGTASVFDTVLGPGSGNNDDWRVDDFFIVNGDAGSAPSDWVGGARVYAIRPSGAGASTEFTASSGSNYACVDESDFTAGSDYVYAAADGLLDTYAMGDITLDGDAVPLGLKVSAIAVNSSAGDRTVKLAVRSGSTDSVGSAQTLTTSARIYERVMALNPATGSAWTESEVDGVEVGFESGS